MENSSAIPLCVLQSSSSYDTVPQHDVELSSALPIQDINQTTSSFSISRKPVIQNKLVPAIHDEKWRARQPKLLPKAFIQASKHKRILHRTITAVVFFISSVFPTIAWYPISAGTAALDSYSTSYIQTNYCSKQGPITDTNRFRGSSITTLLDIGNPVGKFSFGMARFIDLVWDIVISRGGQALLGWVTYRVYTAILMRIAETQIVPYDLYVSLSLSWANVFTLASVIKNFLKLTGFRSRLLLLWMIISIIWVVLWPTITNSMTGYVSMYNSDLSLIRLTEPSTHSFANFTDVTATSNLVFQFCYAWRGEWHAIPEEESVKTGLCAPPLYSNGPNVTLWNEIAAVVKTTGVAPSSQYPNPEPNNTASISYNNENYYSSVYPHMNMRLAYFFSGQYYTWEYFQWPEWVVCLPSKDYAWGFSRGMTLVACILNFLWCVGTYGVWVHMNRKSQLCRKGRVMGPYRAVVDLAEAIQNDLGTEVCAYSDKELQRELKVFSGVRYQVQHNDRIDESGVPHIGLVSGGGDQKDDVVLEFGTLYGHSGEGLKQG